MTAMAGYVNFSEEKALALLDHRADGTTNAVAFPQVSNESDGTTAGQSKHLNNIQPGTEPGTFAST